MKTTNWFPKYTALRSELELMRASLKDCLAQRDRYHSDLATAEMRLDRLQSRTVQAIHSRAQSPPKEAVIKEEEGVEEKEVELKEEQRMSSSPAVSGQFIGGSVSNFTFTFCLI
jgi:E3 ubiquitin-protein ligase BRE1